MTNELNQSGIGNLGFQGISNSSIDVTQIIGKSFEYNDLCDQLKKAEKYFARLLPDEAEERLQTTNEINLLKERIEQFKADVLKLAETFERIEINTERLKRAKAFFDKGEIGEARAVLESELEQMQDEQARLLKERKEFEEEILPKLRNNSEEFLMLALLTIADYNNQNRFSEVQSYLQRSMESFETKENLFQYASYMLVTNQAAEADRVFEKLETKFGGEMSVEERIAVYVSLGYIYAQQNDFPNAENSSSKALELLNQKESAAFPSYKNNLAASNQNLGVAYQYQGKYPEAEKAYNEAIKIFYEMKEKDLLACAANLVNLHSNLGVVLFGQGKYTEAQGHYLKGIEIIREVEAKHNIGLPLPAVNLLCNMGLLYTIESNFENAKQTFLLGLRIISEVFEDNPQMFLPAKARLLSLLGDVWAKEGNYAEAQKLQEEALAIIIDLVRKEPEFHDALYSIILANLAECYAKNKTNRDAAIRYAAEAIRIIHPLLTSLAPLGEYYLRAVNTLRELGIKDEEMDAVVFPP